MTLTGVFFDAGNTLLSLDYAAIVDVLAGEGFPVTRDEVLAGRKGKGYVVGVISNSDGRLETLVRDAGLAGPLDVIIDSRVVGVEKPDPRIFYLALERTGVAPPEAIRSEEQQ